MTRADLLTIQPTTPIRLADAVNLAFPNGGMTVKGLRREAANGRLAISRIANKDFTTLNAIREMVELCRVQPKELVSTSKVKAQAPCGSSASSASASTEWTGTRREK